MKSAPLFPTVLLFAAVAPAGAVSHQPFGEIEGLVAAEERRAGEWIQLLVRRGEKVAAGQKLAVQRNARGEVVQEYTTSAAGEVIITGRVESGNSNTILEIGTRTADAVCGDSDCGPVDRD